MGTNRFCAPLQERRVPSFSWTTDGPKPRRAKPPARGARSRQEIEGDGRKAGLHLGDARLARTELLGDPGTSCVAIYIEDETTSTTVVHLERSDALLVDPW